MLNLLFLYLVVDALGVSGAVKELSPGSETSSSVNIPSYSLPSDSSSLGLSSYPLPGASSSISIPSYSLPSASNSLNLPTYSLPSVSGSPTISEFPLPSNSQACGGCYGVAAIGQLIEGIDYSTYTHLGDFSWSLESPSVLYMTGETPLNIPFSAASVITFNSQPISNPALYNLITSYAFVTMTLDGSSCTATPLISDSDSSVYSGTTCFDIPPGKPGPYISAAQSSFIGGFPQLTCSAGPNGRATLRQLGAAVVDTSLTVAGSTTTTSTNARTTAAIPTDTTSTNTTNSPTLKIAIGVGVGIGGTVACVISVLFNIRSRASKVRKAAMRNSMAEFPDRGFGHTGELSSWRLDWQAGSRNDRFSQDLGVGRQPKLE